MIVLLGTLLPGLARSQSFDIDHLQLQTTGGDFLATESAGRMFPWQWRAGAAYSYADEPLTLVHPDGTRDPLVGARSILELSGALAFTRRIALGLALPVLLDQSGSGVPGGAEIGDVRLVPRFDVVRRQHVAFALYAGLRLPTGATNRFLGEGMVVFEPRAAVEAYLGPRDLVRLGANLGFRFREPRSYGDLDVGQEILASLAAAVLPLPWLDLLAELHLSTMMSDRFGSGQVSPVELLLGAGGSWKGFRLGAAAGLGLVDGFGQPRARALVVFEYRKPPPPPPPLPPPAPVVVTVEPSPPPPAASPPPPEPEAPPAQAVEETDDPKPSEEPSVSVSRSRIELADPIFFAKDRKRIRSRYWDELDQLARVLNRRPEITTVWIEGHADATGPERWNLELSRLRAAEVAKFLTRRHVDPARLKPVGYGEAKPLVATPRGQDNEANRRVHFYTDHQPPPPPTEVGPRAELRP